MILRRLADALRRQDWSSVILEVLIVVLGVFIGIQVANWNDARLETDREAIYLAALREDFSQIVAELEADAHSYETMANAMTFLLGQSQKPAPDASVADLNNAARQLIRMEGTPIVADTYSNLTGSGDLSIIKSQALKNELTSFYSYIAVIQLVANTHELQLVNIFQPYIINNLDYAVLLEEDRGVPRPLASAPEKIVPALSTQEFRNVVSIKWDITTDIRNVLLGALDRARVVQTRLVRESEDQS